MASDFYEFKGQTHAFWTPEDAAILAKQMSGDARNAAEAHKRIRIWSRNYVAGHEADVAYMRCRTPVIPGEIQP